MSPATALAALVVLSACVRFAAARTVPSPWIAPDEMLYALLGRGLGEHLRLQVLNGQPGFYSLVYPALIALPLKLGDMATAYTAVKVVQAAVMSLTAVPVYLWGRRLMRPWWAVGAAALTLAIPGLAYTGMLMTEVAFYPATVLAAWATARAIERPTLGRQAQLVATLALAVGIRLQAVVLLPAALTAVALAAWLGRDVRRVRAFGPLAAATALFVAVAALAGSTALGGYSVVGSGSYRLGDVAASIAYHLGGLLLLTGVVPAIAVVLLALEARGRETQAYVATAIAFVAWTVVEVGVFVSRFGEGVGERYLLGLAPLCFLGLCAWLDRGAPRTYVAGSATAFAAAALLVTLPYDRFATLARVQDSMTFAAVLPLLEAHPGLDALTLIGVPAVVLAALATVLPRRLLPALAAVVLAALVVASVAATREVAALSRATELRLVGTSPRWIDDVADGPVAYVFGDGGLFTAAWLNPFWNRRIAAVYDLPGFHVEGPMPQRMLALGGDGVMRVDGRPIAERYVVLPAGLTAEGQPVATAQLVDAGEPDRVLWRLDGDPRLLEKRGGFQPNGDIPYRADVREFGCARGGTFSVTFLGKTDETVDLFVNGRLAKQVSLKADDTPTVYVPATASPRGDCLLTLKPSTLVGTTTISFGRG